MASVLISGISEKRTNAQQEQGNSRKRPKTPICGTRPIVEMMIHWKNQKYLARVLLDTGCSTPLISKQTVGKLRLPCQQHEQQIGIHNFTGELVARAGQEYTIPITLQHRKHYSQEVFEVAPLELEVDIVLPFWWIVKHAPQGAWNNSKLCFNSLSCAKHCTEAATTTQFSLSIDPSIIGHPKAQIVGYVSVASTANPLDLVPKEFRQFLAIMGKAAADAPPKHSSYDHEIPLKEGEKPLWGPIYPLSEVELETLWEYLKEKMKTGKIR